MPSRASAPYFAASASVRSDVVQGTAFTVARRKWGQACAGKPLSIAAWRWPRMPWQPRQVSCTIGRDRRVESLRLAGELGEEDRVAAGQAHRRWCARRHRARG